MHARKFVFSVVLVLVLSFSFIQPASAHQTVISGPYKIELGWLNEPPIRGQMNAIVMIISSATSPDPVPNDGINLILNVSYAGQTRVLTLQPRGQNAPGQFIAPILPTAAGVYSVDVEGSVGSTDDIEANVQLEAVQPGEAVPFPPLDPASSRGIFTLADGFALAALLLSLGALAVSIRALRKRG